MSNDSSTKTRSPCLRMAKHLIIAKLRIVSRVGLSVATYIFFTLKYKMSYSLQSVQYNVKVRILKVRDTQDDEEGVEDDDQEGRVEGKVGPILVTVCRVLAKVIGKQNMVSLSPHSQNCHTLPPAIIVCVVYVHLFVI